MALAAAWGITPARASARARAASKTSSCRTCASAEKVAAIAGVVNSASIGSLMAWLLFIAKSKNIERTSIVKPLCGRHSTASIFLHPAVEIEEHRFARALQHDVEAIHDGPVAAPSPSQQRIPALIRHAAQHRVLGIARLVREVDARHEMIEQAAGEYGDTDMRR